jgi:hypothetical protein
VLAGDGVELLELELPGFGPRILFRDVVEAGVGAADQLYQDGIRLGHEIGSGEFSGDAGRKIAIHRPLSRQARLVLLPLRAERRLRKGLLRWRAPPDRRAPDLRGAALRP